MVLRQGHSFQDSQTLYIFLESWFLFPSPEHLPLTHNFFNLVLTIPNVFDMVRGVKNVYSAQAFNVHGAY